MHANAIRHPHVTHRRGPARRDLVLLPAAARPVRSRKAARRRLVRLALFVTILLLALFGAPKLVQTLTPAKEVPVTEHRVTRGDSLWQIAAQYRPESDPRQVIAQIKQINRLAGPTLQPGQRLLIPQAVGS